MSLQEPANVDLRIRRTRLHIEKAFVALLQERAFDEITVHAIAERAIVNRATFYDHFADKHELFTMVAERQFLDQLQRNRVGDDTQPAPLVESLIVTICQFLAGLTDLCHPSTIHELPPVDQFITGVLATTLLPACRRTERGSTEVSPNLNAEIASWAIYGAARHWSNQVNREPVRPYARRVAPGVVALIGQG